MSEFKKLLIVDDESIREYTLLSFWKTFLNTDKLFHVWLYDFCDNWIDFLEKSKFDCFSFDNDLGKNETIKILKHEVYFSDNFDRLKNIFKDKLVIIHSTNTVASEELVNVFKDLEANVKKISLLDMIED